MWGLYTSVHHLNMFITCAKNRFEILLYHTGAHKVLHHFTPSPVCSAWPKVTVFISAIKEYLSGTLYLKCVNWGTSSCNVSLYRWFMSAADSFQLRRTEFEHSSNCIQHMSFGTGVTWQQETQHNILQVFEIGSFPWLTALQSEIAMKFNMAPQSLERTENSYYILFY
jgi:hypothetical protein